MKIERRRRAHRLRDAAEESRLRAGAAGADAGDAVGGVVVRRDPPAGGRPAAGRRHRRSRRSTTRRSRWAPAPRRSRRKKSWRSSAAAQSRSQPRPASEPEALQQMGSAELREQARPRLPEAGPPPEFYTYFCAYRRRHLRPAAALLLLDHGGRAVRGAAAADLLGDAARHPHRGRAGRDPVRHHDGDRIGRGRRRRRVPAGLPGAHARLEAHQGGGVPHRQDHRDGVLAVRRLGAVLGGVRDPRRPGAGRAAGCCRST